mgnify:CR=1 FL=1
MRGATYCFYRSAYLYHFNSHAPCGAQPAPLTLVRLLLLYFNSHAPCGAQPDLPLQIVYLQRLKFQLTRPMRGATIFRTVYVCKSINFNSHAPCGAQPVMFMLYIISIRFQLTRPMRGATRILK